MGCGNCSGSNGVPAGCKSNGACASGGCDKMSVFDWLTNMEMPNGMSRFDGVEIRFKNNRKHFFRDIENLGLVPGDVVVTEASPGHDVGVVSAVGELARMQMNRKHPNQKTHELRKVYRKAHENDIEKWKDAKGMETETMYRARELALQHQLSMKISDVEYQGDRNKATFYYTADERVDFRSLLKSLADAFKVRIEMKQIGARQEAGRLGGIGSCGRELCCATWLNDFRSVSTSAARYQQLSLNPQKLAGQCGKLKCCLNFELDQYIEAFKQFPSNDIRLETKKGTAVHQKTDIFKGLMWYAYLDPKHGGVHVPLNADRVKEIIGLNKKGEKPEGLESFKEIVFTEKLPDYSNVVGQDDLTRFDKAFQKKKRKKKRPNQNQKKQHVGGNQSKSSGKGGNPQNAKSGNKPRPKQKKRPNSNNKPKPNNNQKK